MSDVQTLSVRILVRFINLNIEFFSQLFENQGEFPKWVETQSEKLQLQILRLNTRIATAVNGNDKLVKEV